MNGRAVRFGGRAGEGGAVAEVTRDGVGIDDAISH